MQCTRGAMQLKQVPYDVDLTIRDLRAAPLAKDVVGRLEVALRAGIGADLGLSTNVI